MTHVHDHGTEHAMGMAMGMAMPMPWHLSLSLTLVIDNSFCQSTQPSPRQKEPGAMTRLLLVHDMYREEFFVDWKIINEWNKFPTDCQ